MLEYCSKRVLVREEDKTINRKAIFGWILQDSQEVYYKNTHATKARKGFFGGSVVTQTHTDVTNYVVLHFVRDTNIPNYIELKTLESAYDKYDNVSMFNKPIIATCILAFSLLISIWLISGTIRDAISYGYLIIWELVCSIIVTIFSCIMLWQTIVGWVTHNRSKKNFKYANEQCQKILQQAKDISQSIDL